MRLSEAVFRQWNRLYFTALLCIAIYKQIRFGWNVRFRCSLACFYVTERLPVELIYLGTYHWSCKHHVWKTSTQKTNSRFGSDAHMGIVKHVLRMAFHNVNDNLELLLHKLLWVFWANQRPISSKSMMCHCRFFHSNIKCKSMFAFADRWTYTLRMTTRYQSIAAFVVLRNIILMFV